MSRSLTAVVHHPADLLRPVARPWNTCWYTPADSILLGVIRMMTGLILAYTRGLGMTLEDFFGQDAWSRRDLANLSLTDWYAYSFS